MSRQQTGKSMGQNIQFLISLMPHVKFFFCARTTELNQDDFWFRGSGGEKVSKGFSSTAAAVQRSVCGFPVKPAVNEFVTSAH